MAPQDYQITKVDLGKPNRKTDMKFFEVSNKKIAERVWKDGQDKQEMKETIKSMAQYINAVLHPEAKPISEMSVIVDVSSVANQQSLENLHKCKAVAKIAGEWVLDVLHNTVKHIGHLDQASKEILNISKKVETSNDGYEKERNNWSKIVIWLEDVQELGLQKFLAECPVAGLDEKSLYVIKDCIEWRNEVLTEGISEVKEAL